MALPTQYLTSAKNLTAIFNTIQGAQAPDKFTIKWLEQQGFNSSADRLVVGVLKALGFIDVTGKPLQRYYDYLDQSQSTRVLAEAIRDTYSDLFKLNKNAQNWTKAELTNKLKTLGEGRLSDAVLNKMTMTFESLVKNADFTTPPRIDHEPHDVRQSQDEAKKESSDRLHDKRHQRQIGVTDLVYNIQIHLPETRDASVYDAIFRSLKEHPM